MEKSLKGIVGKRLTYRQPVIGVHVYKPHKALAFIDNGFLAFFTGSPWHHMAAHMKAAHIIYTWPVIEAKIREGQTGRCWRIPCNAKRTEGKVIDLRLSPAALEPLEIPDYVLKSVRQAQSG